MQGRTLATSNICNPMTSWKKLSLRRITFGTEVGGVDLSLFTIFPNFLIATGALFVVMRHKRCSFWDNIPFPIDIYIQVGKTTSVIVESKFLLVRRFLQSPEASKVNHHHTQLVSN